MNLHHPAWWVSSSQYRVLMTLHLKILSHQQVIHKKWCSCTNMPLVQKPLLTIACLLFNLESRCTGTWEASWQPRRWTASLSACMLLLSLLRSTSAVSVSAVLLQLLKEWSPCTTISAPQWGGAICPRIMGSNLPQKWCPVMTWDKRHVLLTICNQHTWDLVNHSWLESCSRSGVAITWVVWSGESEGLLLKPWRLLAGIILRAICSADSSCACLWNASSNASICCCCACNTAWCCRRWSCFCCCAAVVSNSSVLCIWTTAWMVQPTFA